MLPPPPLVVVVEGKRIAPPEEPRSHSHQPSPLWPSDARPALINALESIEVRYLACAAAASAAATVDEDGMLVDATGRDGVRNARRSPPPAAARSEELEWEA